MLTELIIGFALGVVVGRWSSRFKIIDNQK